MIVEIVMFVMFIVIVALLGYGLHKRDEVKRLNILCDRYSQKLVDERKSMSVERENMKWDLYKAKQSYKRAESKFMI